MPTFLGARYYADFSDDDKFDEIFEELVRQLHQAPPRGKPNLGPNPFHESKAPMPVHANRRDAASARRGTLQRLLDQLTETESVTLKFIRTYIDANPNKRLQSGPAPSGGTGVYTAVPLAEMTTAVLGSSSETPTLELMLDNLQRVNLLLRMPQDGGLSSFGCGPEGPVRCRHLELSNLGQQLIHYCDALSADRPFGIGGDRDDWPTGET